MRTTIDIDDPILEEVRSLRRKEGKSLGRLVSDLLAQGLRARRAARGERRALRWVARPMAARVDLADKEALYAALDREAPPFPGRTGRS
jgi:hypothetical protein